MGGAYFANCLGHGGCPGARGGQEMAEERGVDLRRGSLRSSWCCGGALRPSWEYLSFGVDVRWAKSRQDFCHVQKLPG